MRPEFPLKPAPASGQTPSRVVPSVPSSRPCGGIASRRTRLFGDWCRASLESANPVGRFGMRDHRGMASRFELTLFTPRVWTSLHCRRGTGTFAGLVGAVNDALPSTLTVQPFATRCGAGSRVVCSWYRLYWERSLFCFWLHNGSAFPTLHSSLRVSPCSRWRSRAFLTCFAIRSCAPSQ